MEYWNKGNTSTALNNNTVYKTIYSTSPTGYSEPQSAVFTGFINTKDAYTSNSNLFNKNSSFNKGWNFYSQPNFTGNTVFFAALGVRDVYSGWINASSGGTLISVGVWGTYLLSGLGPNYNVRYLIFSTDYIYPQIGYIGYGSAIRPVSE